MKRVLGIAAGVATLALVLGAGRVAGAEQPGAPSGFLHVRVDESGKGSKVSINLPLSVVAVALEAAPETLESGGKVKFGRGGHDMSLADLRRVWKELKNAGDTDFVTVEEPDGENVKIVRRGELVEVHVSKAGKEAVNVQVPVSLVDVLLAGEGERLNVKAALLELQKRQGDIVRVQDEHSNVRIWIDGQN